MEIDSVHKFLEQAECDQEVAELMEYYQSTLNHIRNVYGDEMTSNSIDRITPLLEKEEK